MPAPLDNQRLVHRNRDRSTVVCHNGIVCASQPLAAMAGIDILKAGGNCVDAAIAVNAMLGLTEPSMNGIGGDLFAIHWSATDNALAGLNASGCAPTGWTLEAAQARGLDSIPRQSPLSWTVPGCVAGWDALSRRFGRLSLGQCLEPAIEYAESGFPLSPIIARDFAEVGTLHPTLEDVYGGGGTPLTFGSRFTNPALAKSLRSIAADGAEAFYKGEIAERIVAKSTELGGLMSMDDLSAFEPEWVEPISTSYRGFDVWELPPNGQGIATLEILNLLEHFDIGSLEHNGSQHLHLLIEAKRLAFEDRARFYADPKFADIPLSWLVSKDYAADRVGEIDPRRANANVVAGEPPQGADTVYLTVADGDGNMISYIQSIYGAFGSQICPDGVGFAMQNRGQSFSLDPTHANRLEPGKRPFHTIIPAFVTQASRPRMSFGVMGGDFQPQGQAQVLMNMFDFGMSPQQAGDSARAWHDGSSTPWLGRATDQGTVGLERGIDESVAAELERMGHRIERDAGVAGGYQAIWREDDPLTYFGGSDPRKDGAAVGY